MTVVSPTVLVEVTVMVEVDVEERGEGMFEDLISARSAAFSTRGHDGHESMAMYFLSVLLHESGHRAVCFADCLIPHHHRFRARDDKRLHSQ